MGAQQKSSMNIKLVEHERGHLSNLFPKLPRVLQYVGGPAVRRPKTYQALCFLILAFDKKALLTEFLFSGPPKLASKKKNRYLQSTWTMNMHCPSSEYPETSPITVLRWPWKTWASLTKTWTLHGDNAWNLPVDFFHLRKVTTSATPFRVGVVKGGSDGNNILILRFQHTPSLPPTFLRNLRRNCIE